MSRLLIMSCGKRKRLSTTLLPALERYDGPSFRVLRRYLATSPTSPPDIYILSAKFGLIPGHQPIPYYDQRLTLQRAIELRPSVQSELAHTLNRFEYEQIFLAAGRDYEQALEGYIAIVPAATAVKVASGSQGKRLAQLYDWLYGPSMLVTPPAQRPVTMLVPDQQHKNPQLKGMEISLTVDQVLTCARQAFATDAYGSGRFHSWYVSLDGQRIAPKWLISKVTGFPPGTFTTREALRVLAQIGIPVHRADLW